jgi:hypothetical protein
MLSTNDNSNSVKISYLEGYTEIYNENIFTGQGFNAISHSSRFREMFSYSALQRGAFKLELTYLELLRVYGLIFGFIYLLLLYYMVALVLIRKKNIEFNWFSISFVFYMISSSLNPYLFASIGSIVFVFYFAIMFQNYNNKIHKYI